MTTSKRLGQYKKPTKSLTERAADAFERTKNGVDAWRAMYLAITHDEPLPEPLEEYFLAVAVAVMQRSKVLRIPWKLSNKKGAAADADVIRAMQLRPRGRSVIRLEVERQRRNKIRIEVEDLKKSGMSQAAARKQVRDAMKPSMSDSRLRRILTTLD